MFPACITQVLVKLFQKFVDSEQGLKMKEMGIACHSSSYSWDANLWLHMYNLLHTSSLCVYPYIVIFSDYYLTKLNKEAYLFRSCYKSIIFTPQLVNANFKTNCLNLSRLTLKINVTK
jgi:hypothetical protein